VGEVEARPDPFLRPGTKGDLIGKPSIVPGPVLRASLTSSPTTPGQWEGVGACRQSIDADGPVPAPPTRVLMAIPIGVRQEAVEHLAARLSNTGQVLGAWAQALGDSNDLLGRRLRRAVQELQGAVDSLTLGEKEFLALEKGGLPDEPEDRGRGKSRGEIVEHPDSDSLDRDDFGMRGRSEMISCIEFVAFLSSLGKDGVLQMQTEDQQFILELREGCVIYTAVEPEPDTGHLGEILRQQGVLSEDALTKGLEDIGTEEFLGEALLRQGRISRDSLVAALTEQALRVFCAIHAVGAGFDFQFQEKTRIIVVPDIRLGISHLLLESARLVDERTKSEWEDAEAGATHDLDRYRAHLVEALEEGNLRLPVLPDAAGQLLALCWSEDFDVEQLLECVHHDQALCAHLLRIANSAAYAPVTPISSIQLAITRLGIDKLREVAMALTLKQEVFKIPGWEKLILALWRTAAVTGGFARAISKTCGAGAARGSMGGLLLDVGKPVVLGSLYEIAREIDAVLTPEIADTLMEEYHPRIGSLIAKSWSLPDWLTEVMCHHHDLSGADEHRTEILIGSLAGECAIWAEASDQEERERLVDLAQCEALGLVRDEMIAILEQSKSIVEMAKLYS
jgi:HD-like signal output (HDOD) protein